ncbi:MAG: LLM class flavin-dependent oxidoreductase [Dehalococcoidia bacterium]
MEIGLLYDLRNPPEWHIPTHELYAETLDHIQAMEALGFPVIWVTEHHFIDDEYLPSCLTFASAIAVKTKKVTIGTAVLLLPLHDPIQVAEDAAVVDNLSNGRLRLGLGIGYKLEEFEAFGVPRKERGSRMEEGIEVIKRAWGNGPAGFEGKHYRFDNINVTPKPVQRPVPEIWLAGRADVTVERAARVGDGLLAVGDASLHRKFKDAWARNGRSGPARVGAFAWSYPADNPGMAWESCGAHTAYRAKNYADWYGAAADLPTDRTWRSAADAGASPGTNANLFQHPEQTVEHLLTLASNGVDSAIYFATFPGLRPSATIPFFELMAKEVLRRV